MEIGQVYTCEYVCIYMSTYIPTYLPTYIHTYIHDTCIHTYTYESICQAIGADSAEARVPLLKLLLISYVPALTHLKSLCVGGFVMVLIHSAHVSELEISIFLGGLAIETLLLYLVVSWLVLQVQSQIHKLDKHQKSGDDGMAYCVCERRP